MKRILIIDRHPLMREALRMVIRSIWPTANIVEGGALSEAEAACRGPSAIELVVIDPNLPDAQGLGALTLLERRLPGTPIVVFSPARGHEAAASSHILGAAAHIPKSALMSEVAQTLRKVANGERVFLAAEPLKTSAQDLGTARKRLSSLSPAQMRVLMNIASGRPNKQVAAEMNVTEATIKAHMTAIFRKLQVINRAQAILAVQPLLDTRQAA